MTTSWETSDLDNYLIIEEKFLIWTFKQKIINPNLRHFKIILKKRY